MSRPLKVWLAEYPGALPAGSDQEGRLVRARIRGRLQTWFQRVVRHSNARRRQPDGFRPAAQVTWTTSPSAGQVGQRDLVIHFSPAVAGAPGASSAPGPVLGPYRTAAGQLQDRQLRQRLTSIRRGSSGGYTQRAQVGSRSVPILSIVYVNYNRQLSILQARISTNVNTLSVIAFHEAAHNKDPSNSLHTAGGGGVFADYHTGGLGTATQPNGANIAFFAERIWNWGPQYLVGRPLTPVALSLR